MSTAAPAKTPTKDSGPRIPGFAQLQRLGKSLMLPIALLPAAGILLRLGQPDLLGQIKIPVIGPFFEAMSAGGDAIFGNLALLFAVGVAIGFAKKADGSTALSAVAGYLVMTAVFKSMSPVVLAGVMNSAGTQAQINYSVFGGILIGLITAWLFDKYHDIQLPPYLGFFGGRRFVPIVVSLSTRPSCGLSARPAWSRSATTCRPSSAPRPTPSKTTSTTPWWPTRPIRSRPSRPSKRSPRPPRWPPSTCPAPPSWRRSPAVRWR